MRTFEQYIDEAYNFRLGGSKQKGFDQTKPKTFADIEVGDDIYIYYESYFNGPAKILDSKVTKFVTHEDGDMYIWYKNSIFSAEVRVTLSKDDVNKTSVYEKSGIRNKSAISTSLDELKDVVKEKLGVDPSKLEIKESYNFRLGGSQQKGFDQTKAKPFDKLEKGDTVYYFSDKFYLKISAVIFGYLKKTKFQSGDYYLKLLDKNNNEEYNIVYLTPQEIKQTIAFNKDHEIVCTDKEEFIKTMREKFPKYNHIIDEIDESYNFRLGGSQQKGFDQNRPKPFAKLRKGDKVYVWVDTQGKDVAGVFTVESMTMSDEDNYLELNFYIDKNYNIKYKFPVDSPKDFNAVVLKQNVPHAEGYIVSTDLNSLEEAVKDAYGYKITKYKKNFKELIDKSKIDEAYNFRLGGSQKKGFEQNKVKTFNELKRGDKFYFWNVKSSLSEFTLDKDLYIKGDEFRLGCNGSAYYYGYVEDIDKSYSCSKNDAWVIATNFEVLCEIAKEKFDIILDYKNLKEY